MKFYQHTVEHTFSSPLAVDGLMCTSYSVMLLKMLGPAATSEWLRNPATTATPVSTYASPQQLCEGSVPQPPLAKN